MATQYQGTGRRKTSVARVRLVDGSGKFIINKRDMDEYFDYETLKIIDALSTLAGSAGIPVAKNLQSRPELAEIPALEVNSDDDMID